MPTIAPAPFVDLDLDLAAGLPSDEVLARLGSGPGGLPTGVAADRLRQVGPNLLGIHRLRAVTVLFRQVRNPILLTSVA